MTAHPQPGSHAGNPQEKAAAYKALHREIAAVLDGETDRVARMATTACMLAQAFAEQFFWTGFYCVDPERPNELVIGPYQGTLGCLRIAFGRGVCGLAAAEARSIIVEDVHSFAGHIACDARTNSEIVCPVFDPAGSLIAVLDIDSTQPAAFDKIDQDALETLLGDVFGKGSK